MTTQLKPLDVDEVRALLVRAVEEKGADYVYVDPDGHSAPDAKCQNFDATGAPSCIAGHVYSYVGIQTPRYATVHGVQAAGHFFTDAAAIGLLAAQIVQDNGKTWGEALAAFDEAVKS